MRIVASGAMDAATSRCEATAEHECGSLDPGEFRVAGLDRAVGSVALFARLEELSWRRVPCPADRPLGEPRSDGLVMVEPRSKAPLAADPLVEHLGAARK